MSEMLVRTTSSRDRLPTRCALMRTCFAPSSDCSALPASRDRSAARAASFCTPDARELRRAAWPRCCMATRSCGVASDPSVHRIEQPRRSRRRASRQRCSQPPVGRTAQLDIVRSEMLRPEAACADPATAPASAVLAVPSTSRFTSKFRTSRNTRLPKPAFEVVAVRMQRHAVEVRAAHRRPLVIRRRCTLLCTKTWLTRQCIAAPVRPSTARRNPRADVERSAGFARGARSAIRDTPLRRDSG